ncbi:MAG: hypothetical protein IH961_01155 [Chloroflexi bacterium]|nr:hypothetical protein [Chloroflexota bacterium]
MTSPVSTRVSTDVALMGHLMRRAGFGGQTVSLPDDEQITMPISVAVATFPDDGDSADVLLERAMQRAT